MAERPLYPVNRRHLDALEGPYGIWQHAMGSIPNVAFGYCTDDVARALVVDLLHAHALGWAEVKTSALRSLRFLSEALVPSTGRFRNFRSRDGTWTEEVGSEDCHGRAMLALGVTLAEAPDDEVVAQARSLFLGGLPAARAMISPRAISSVILGCSAAFDAGLRGETRQTLEELASRLKRAFARVRPDRDWPWPEAELTYESGLLPQALVTAGALLGDYELRSTGVKVLNWLVLTSTARDGTFSPIGNKGWWPRGGIRSPFDQQPIEATSMILAAEAALRYTGEERYLKVIEAAYAWFLGDNDLGLPLAEPARGSCRDGLSSESVNANEGAESTLMWLTALEHVRLVRASALSQHEFRPSRVTADGRS